MTQQYVKVQGHDGLVRDRATGAIVNTNRADFDSYIARRDAAEKRQQQVDKHDADLNILKADMSMLKQDMAEIKQLLLLALKNGG